MTTHTQTTKKNRIRDSLRYVLQDTHNADRALFRRPAYDDYLFNHRDTHR
jgi:hypothetical protein